MSHARIPNDFLTGAARIGLTPTEQLLLIHVLRHEEQAPTHAELARSVGVLERHVRFLLRSLESRGFLVRVPRFDPDRPASRLGNSYDLAGLFAKLGATEAA